MPLGAISSANGQHRETRLAQAPSRGPRENNPREQGTDVVILRGHALVEAGLFTLLAAHLRVETTDLKMRLTFDLFARIALARPSHAALRKLVLSLNTARNSYAHAVEPDTVAIIRAFISEMPNDLVAAGKAHGATDVEIAAGAISFILSAILRVGLQITRYRPGA